MCSRKVSILFVCIGTNVGGIEKGLINILDSIDYSMCDVDLILWEKPGELYPLIPKKVHVLDRGSVDVVEREFLKDYSFTCRFNILRRYVIKMIYGRTNGMVWKSAKRIHKRYDIAIAFSQNDYSGEYIIDRINAEKKYLWFHHGTYEFDDLKKKFNVEYYPKFDSIIAVSEACKNELLKYFPTLDEKIKVIYNKINPDEIIEKSQLNVVSDVVIHGKCIVTVGRIAEEKGTEVAIEVARELKNNGFNFTWIFVGKGTLWDEIYGKISSYGLEEDCILVGAKTNPYPYMNLADIYVQPSKVEAFGLTVAEAKILDKYIIASDLPEIKKQLIGYDKSKIVKPSVSSLYSALADALQQLN